MTNQALQFNLEQVIYEEDTERNLGFEWYITTEYTDQQKKLRDEVLTDRIDDAVKVAALCKSLSKVSSRSSLVQCINQLSHNSP